tara:strand:- start:1493 stop:2230 length:738 start_codon:yes stop_codon:yes gene_type:complete
MNNLSHNQFNVNLESYEGPIDLLLDLAKNQKVDLSKISVLKLAEQYLDYINIAKKINLEIVSDYLVMAAWLTYLKSRLLLPKKINSDEPSAEELEEAVKFQLRRLEAMQNVSKILFNLPQVGINVFYRGSSHGARFKYEKQYSSSLFDLLTSYAKQIGKNNTNQLKIKMSELYSVDNAIERLKNIFGNFNDWIEIRKLLPEISNNVLINKSAISSTLVASLELVKNGFIEVKQNKMFGPIFLKMK